MCLMDGQVLLMNVQSLHTLYLQGGVDYNRLPAKGNHIVIPTNICHDCLETLHASYLGVNQTLMQVCTSVFWPCMTADITALISNCPACQKFQSKQPPETLRNELLTTMEKSCHWYIWTLWKAWSHCYRLLLQVYSGLQGDRPQCWTNYSHFFLEIFSEFGIPDEICSDRGTNYTSSLFLAFCKCLDIKLSFSSAYHCSGNPAQHSVQIVKNIMRKCKYTNPNWRLGLLEYLCTPLSEKLPSPAELLAGRQFKGLQTTLSEKLTPDTSFSEQVMEQLVAKKEMEMLQHDKSTHDLQIFAIGSTVMYYDHRSKSWLVGRIPWSHTIGVTFILHP